MKKRKNIFISVITCFASICLMMFGVYASANPSVSINGQVSYSVHDAKVLVQGKANGQADANGTAQVSVEYPTVADTTNITESQITSGNQYLSYTTGTGFDDASDDLQTWQLGGLNFYEDNSGVKPITLSFKITNLANYPVQGSVSFDVADISNVQRTTGGLTSSNTVYIDSNASKQITVTYTIVDDAQTVSNADIGMTITFEKTTFQPTVEGIYCPSTEDPETLEEASLSDWQYRFEGDSYTITKYVGTFPESKTLVVPSTIKADGVNYPVKAIGAIEAMTEDEVMAIFKDEELLKQAPVVLDVDDYQAAEGEEYLFTLPIVTIPEGIEVINAGAFFMTPVQSLPTSIKKIGAVAFDTSGRILNIAFEQNFSSQLDLSNCEEIGAGAFFEGGVLSGEGITLTLGKHLKNIGYGAFDSCSIKEVYLKATSPITTCDAKIFGTVENDLFKIYIPTVQYKTAPNWLDYEPYMVFDGSIETATVSDWQARFYEDGTCDIIKYTGDTTIETLIVPSTLQYNNKTYNVQSVGTALVADEDGTISTTEDFLLFNQREGTTFDESDLDFMVFGSIVVGGSEITEEDGSIFPKFKNIVVQDGITTIGSGAFMGCWKAESITLPQSVNTISYCAFGLCQSLQSITIPNGVESLDMAFYGCIKLSKVYLPSSLKDLTYTFAWCTSLKSVTLPRKLTSIGEWAFFNSGLTSITIPSKVTSIGKQAFKGCSSLTQVTLYEGLESIGDYAFDGCSSLTSITIPSSVTSIGTNAFCHCTSITNVTFAGTTPPSMMDSHPFNGCSSLTTIYVPAGCTDVYQTAIANIPYLKDCTIVEME